jgi:hypothetical protein
VRNHVGYLMDDRDLIHGEVDEDSTVEGKELDRETKAADEALREAAERGAEGDEAEFLKDEYGSRPA